MKNDDPVKRQCSDQALVNFIATQLRCPDSVSISGTIIVSFVVDENGTVGQDSVLRNFSGNCGEAAKNVLRSMPPWEPGMHNDKKVRVRLTLPIRFSNQNKVMDESENYSIQWGKLRGDKTTKTFLQQCLSEQIYVRDDYGNAMHILELAFISEKKNRSNEARTSGGTPDKRMKKLLQKISKGSTFTISATVPIEGRFIVVEKSVEVEK